jgi:hypothetical protein
LNLLILNASATTKSRSPDSNESKSRPTTYDFPERNYYRGKLQSLKRKAKIYGALLGGITSQATITEVYIDRGWFQCLPLDTR